MSSDKIHCLFCKWDGAGLELKSEYYRECNLFFAIKVLCTLCGWISNFYMPKSDLEWKE